MNMNRPVLTSMVKKPRAKIKPSPIFSLSWVNFRLFRIGNGKINTGVSCQTKMLTAPTKADEWPADHFDIALTQKLSDYVQRPRHLLQVRIRKRRAFEGIEPVV